MIDQATKDELTNLEYRVLAPGDIGNGGDATRWTMIPPNARMKTFYFANDELAWQAALTWKNAH